MAGIELRPHRVGLLATVVQKTTQAGERITPGIALAGDKTLHYDQSSNSTVSVLELKRTGQRRDVAIRRNLGQEAPHLQFRVDPQPNSPAGFEKQPVAEHERGVAASRSRPLHG